MIKAGMFADSLSKRLCELSYVQLQTLTYKPVFSYLLKLSARNDDTWGRNLLALGNHDGKRDHKLLAFAENANRVKVRLSSSR